LVSAAGRATGTVQQVGPHAYMHERAAIDHRLAAVRLVRGAAAPRGVEEV
jgi:hypothetical protein